MGVGNDTQNNVQGVSMHWAEQVYEGVCPGQAWKVWAWEAWLEIR